MHDGFEFFVGGGFLVRHHAPDDATPALTGAQRGMLQCLIRKQEAGN